MSTVPKDCKTCGHRNWAILGYHCSLSGYYCTTERRYPTQCGQNYENWIPEPTPLIVRAGKGIAKVAKGLKKVFIIEVKDGHK